MSEQMVELTDGSLAFYPPRQAELGILVCHVKTDGRRPCKWGAQMDSVDQATALLNAHLVEKHPDAPLVGGGVVSEADHERANP